MNINKKGFTLVELVVVIAILALLSTIGFVSYTSYLAGTRDANRVSQLQSIGEGLQKYKITNGFLLPDNNIIVKVDGDEIGYQGYIGKNILNSIEYSAKGIDPKDGSYFSYFLSNNKKYFQLMAFLEKDNDFSVVSGINANDYNNRSPFVLGNNLGIIIDEFNNPIQEVFTGGIDINSSLSVNIKSILNNSEFLEGTGSKIDEFKKLKKINLSGGKGWSVNNNKFVFLGEKSECGIANGKSLLSKPLKKSLCKEGKSSNITKNSGKYEWNCISKSGYATPCSAIALDIKTGQCGSAANGFFVSTPTSNLCSGGTLAYNASNPIKDLGVGKKYIWKCLGQNGGLNKECSSNHVLPSCDETTKPSSSHINLTRNPDDYLQSFIKNSSKCGFTCKDNYIGTQCQVAPCGIDFYRTNISDTSYTSCIAVGNGHYSPSNNNTRYNCTNKPSDNASRHYYYTSDGNGSNHCSYTYSAKCGVDKYESSNGVCSNVGNGHYSPSNNNTRYNCTNKPSDNASRHYYYTSDGNGSNHCSYTYSAKCGVDKYESSNGVCSNVGNGYYSPSNNNTRYNCTNKPSGVSSVTYTSDGNGHNSCHGKYGERKYKSDGWEIRMKYEDRTSAWPVCGSLPKYALIVGSDYGSKFTRYTSNPSGITSVNINGHTIYRGSWQGYWGACGGTARKHWYSKYRVNKTF